jgi:hypothetical protein
MEIEAYTARYEREHGHKPQGKRFFVDAEDHRLTVEHEALQRHNDWPILRLPTKRLQ